MKFSVMIKLIREKINIRALDIPEDGDFLDISLLDHNTANFCDNILYIGNISELSNKNSMPSFLLYFGEENLDNPLNLKNYASIDSNDYAFAFNIIREELMRSLKAEQAYTNMLRMILDGRGLTDILDELTQNTGNPIAVLDISGKIIAHSRSFMVPDPLWIHSVELGYCPYEFMDHIKKVRCKNASPRTAEAFISLCQDTNITYLCSKVLSKEYLLGYVFMFECETPFDKHTKQLLPMISKITSEMILRGNNNVSLRSQLYSSILIDMLDGIDPTQARMRIQNSDLHFSERMKVLYVRPLYYHGENYIKEELHNTLLTIFDKAPSVYYKKGIILIVPVNENYNINESSIDELKNLAQKQHLEVGISNAFMDPAFFAKYYIQAEEALRFSRLLNREDSISNYCDFAFFDMLSRIPMEFHLGTFCHPALARLRQYDHEHHTELYNTLKVLTETGFNQRKTAELLFLHRNTLNYRKLRIEEIGGINLDDTDVLFQLFYSFQIDSFIENKNQ